MTFPFAATRDHQNMRWGEVVIFTTQVTQTALDDVQMSVKRCAIEVLGKLNLPPEDRFRGSSTKMIQNDGLWSVIWKKSCITRDTSGHWEGPFGKLTSNPREVCIDRLLSVMTSNAWACRGMLGLQLLISQLEDYRKR